MAQPNAFLVDSYGNTSKSGIVTAPDGSLQFITYDANGRQVVSAGGGGASNFATIQGQPTDNSSLNSALAAKADATATTTALATKAALNAAQQMQQGAGATTALLNAAKNGFKDPAGGSDIPFGSGGGGGAVTTETTNRSLAALDNGNVGYTPSIVTFTVPAGMVNGFNYHSLGPGAVTYTPASGVTITDNRGTGYPSPWADLQWVQTDVYILNGGKP